MRCLRLAREDYFWLRDELDLKPEEAAARIGIHPSTAWKYEARRKRERRLAGAQ